MLVPIKILILNNYFIISSGCCKTVTVRDNSAVKISAYVNMLIYKTNEPFDLYLKEELKENMTMYRGLNQFPEMQCFPDTISDKSKRNFYFIHFSYTMI